MPKVELPYNEEGMDMAKEIKPKAEAVGGTVDFGGNIPVNNAQERSGEGDVSQYYRIGGGIKFYSGHKGSSQTFSSVASLDFLTLFISFSSFPIKPLALLPKATKTAPVNVAKSIIKLGL